MRTLRIFMISVSCIAVLLAFRQILAPGPVRTLADEPPAGKASDSRGKRDDRVTVIPVSGADSRKDMQPYMHAKLRHSQLVFEGLVTKEFKKVELGAEALMLTSLSTPKLEPDRERNDEVFDHLRLEFVRLAGQLKQLAADQNLEGAAYVSEKLNATCIACHQYLRDELPKVPDAVRHAN